MNPEAKLKRWVIGTLLAGGHCQTIETTTGSGIPDINVCYDGKEFWVETKIAMPTGAVLLRPFQHAWIRRRASFGGKVMVLALEPVTDTVWVWWAYDIVVESQGKYLKIISAPWYSAPRSHTKWTSLMTF